jgi:CHAT domain-containing protein
VRLHALGPVDRIRDAAQYIPFALRRLSAGRARAASLQAATDVLDRAGDLLDDVLLRPLWRHLGDVPLVVVPVGPLQSVPWSLLPSCVGRPVSVSPSATLWHAAAARGRPSPGRVVVVAGPRLDGARTEADAVAGLYPGSRVLVGDDATAANVQEAMDGAALVHLAAHGTVRSDNPLFSSLSLADGPFTVYDLERLRRAPHHVVLAACDTGRSEVVAGDEILGFTAALMAGGTGTVVASVVPVADSPTVSLMAAYHRELGAGSAPAEALARAQAQMRTQPPAFRAAAAGFVLLGIGHQPTATTTATTPSTERLGEALAVAAT